MKTTFTYLILFATILYGYSQNTSIPDSNFEKSLIDLGYDTGNPDGFVPTANISTITYLDVSGKNINDLQGIQNFTALSTLICSNNNLTDIKITNNVALSGLDCSNNNLASLNISENIALVELFCQNNNLETLDASNNPALSIFSCQSNQLTSLNVKNGNPANIASFDARNNLNLTCIEVDDIQFSAAIWTNIDPQTEFKENCVEMAYIPDDNFEKALIDLGYDSGNPDDFVPIANIENIIALDVSNKSIISLSGVEYFSALTTLICSNNNLTNLDVSKNTSLAQLICTNNSISGLNLNSNTTLDLLYCHFNNLTSLDLSNNSALTDLHAYNNQLTSLNVKNGNNTNMLGFNAINNPNLTCIDVDNKAYSTANWTSIDPQAGFSETCGTLNVDNFLKSNILVYPNPTDNIITIKLNNQIEINTVKIFDIQGRQINNAKANIVDLSNFQSGLYFIKMNTNLGRLTKKVIKN